MAQAKKTEKTNMVFLAGTIFNLWARDGSGMVLVNVGDEKRSVPANLFGKEDQPLIDKLSLFDKGDFIQLKGYLRPWAQKIDDKWKNNLEFHITEISTDPPAGRTRQSSAPSGWQGASDDDIPF
jgi:hypothetical protein